MNGFSHRLESTEERMGELEGINREITQNTAQRDQNRESEYGMLSNTEDRHTCNCSPIKRDTNGR